ncbi:MAG: isoamylase early set domain-containing protein [Caldilineaceae bacterium]
MIAKTLSQLPNQVCVTFELPACIAAERIFLAGDFNHWCPTATPLHQEADGVWRVRVELPLGSQYEYRYLIDGDWKTDYHADGLAPNPYGTDNSVVCAMLPALSPLARSSSQVRERRFLLPAHTQPLDPSRRRARRSGTPVPRMSVPKSQAV